MAFLTITICIMLVLVTASFIGCIIGMNRTDKKRAAMVGV